jgi:hypothetical protein
MPDERRIVSPDTPANRMLAAILEDMDHTLDGLLVGPLRLQHPHLVDLLEYVRHARTMGFMAEIEASYSFGAIPQVVALDPRYRAVHETWLALRRDLSAAADNPPDLTSATRSLDYLYEEWVALTVLTRLAQRLGDPVDGRTLAAEARKRQDVTAATNPIQLAGSGGEAKVWLRPIVPFRGGAGELVDGLCALTRDCKPDILVRATPLDAAPRTMVFDAKFSLGDTGLPSSDAVDAVVVYHDNIRAAATPELPAILRSVAIYPGREDRPASPIRRALEHGVGGAPAFPGFTEILEAEVEKILAV